MPAYRFPRFERRVLLDDLSFHGAPAPGELIPDFDLAAIDGGRVRRADFLGRRPLLITIASITCPMTAASRDVLLRLHEEFGEHVSFLSVYVRELHPGERYPQATSLWTKLAHARAYRDRDAIPWRVAVDDVDGLFHKRLGGNSNAAFVVGVDGMIVFRSLVSSDGRALRRGIRKALLHQPPSQKQRHFLPLLRGLGEMRSVIDDAGPTARKDMIREAAPVYGLAWIASLFRPLPPLARGLAAVAAIGLASTGLALAVRRVAR